jgi:hypothetical protein
LMLRRPSPHRPPLKPQAWCWQANSGWKWHDGDKVEDFAPVIPDSELPVELAVCLDCDAGSFSIARDGVLLGGAAVYGGLRAWAGPGGGRELRLAVGTYDDANRVTIVSYAGPS